MTSILHTSIKTLLLDYVLSVLFNKISINFSKFDILSGSRYFKFLIVSYGQSSPFTLFDCEIDGIYQLAGGGYKMVVSFSHPSYKHRRQTNVYFNHIKLCIPGELLSVDKLRR